MGILIHQPLEQIRCSNGTTPSGNFVNWLVIWNSVYFSQYLGWWSNLTLIFFGGLGIPPISKMWLGNPRTQRFFFLMLPCYCWRGSTKKVRMNQGRVDAYPIGSMYAIYGNIGGILMVYVTIYTIHGSYGYVHRTLGHVDHVEHASELMQKSCFASGWLLNHQWKTKFQKFM